MEQKLKTDFEKFISTSNFSNQEIKLKKKALDDFLKNGFPSRKLENWKFSDINQIIKKNIGELTFYNDYKIENEINDHALNVCDRNVYDVNDYVFYEKQWTSFYQKSTFPLPYPFLAEIYHIETSTHQAFLIEL